MEYFDFVIRIVESLKNSDQNCKIIVDTMDFHFKRFARKSAFTENVLDLQLAEEFLKLEKRLYNLADSVVVVSETEKDDIQEKINGIDSLHVIPTIHGLRNAIRPYEKRRHMCFVGNFGHSDNADHIRHFLKNIFGLIVSKNRDHDLHILGHSSSKYRSEFSGPNVKVVGAVKDLHRALGHYKLFICPTTYGSGMKGKIGDAITAGVPVVSTSIGVEGFPVKDGEECFIADSAEDFAVKCHLCLSDPVIWHNLCIKSRLMLAENFSPTAIGRKLKNILTE